ncbi:hypothetical protein BV25DRAFT_1819078 [Artomyces pyxidatus]|uniref:Uncharacterized protein n=1 Tax=Artomyces pyxidatus TaxID=48021 RepID=A0ACB8TGV1_9AGAM|nr:hypothetical protein BV25DRAFT_1819078 [Artomyces pyxidatus]
MSVSLTSSISSYPMDGGEDGKNVARKHVSRANLQAALAQEREGVGDGVGAGGGVGSAGEG